MHRSWRKILLAVVALVVVGGLLYRSRNAIGLQGFSWASLAGAVRDANGWLLLLALAGIYAAFFLRSLRWVRFCRYLGNAGVWSVYRSTLVGFSVTFLLGRAGEPIRPLLIARKEKLPVSPMFGIYVLERLFDVGATATLAGITLLLFPHLAVPGTESARWLAVARSTGITLLVGFAAAVIFLIYFRLHGAQWMERRLQGWRSHRGWRARVAGLFSGFGDGLQAIRTRGDLAVAVGYSVSHWLLIVFIYVWIMHSFGGRLAEIGVPGAMLVLAFSMVGSAVQLPGVGGGSQVACYIAFTLFFGVESGPALVAAVVTWLITFAGATLAGIPMLVQEGWSMGELRRIARAEAEAEAAGSHIPAPEPHREEPRS